MIEWLLLSAVLMPLLLAPLAVRSRGDATLLAAPVPALLGAILIPVGAELSLPWLLLGTRIGLDETARAFLLFSALLWLAGGLYARDTLHHAKAPRFRLFFLLAMAGNFYLILAQDAASYYLGFSVMGLAAYGLVAHRPSVGVRRAARVYLSWTVLGEILLFAALVLLAVAGSGLGFREIRGSPPSDAVMLLLVLGFGIKVALPGLHLWLPLAYPAAPAAGAAVLSGSMINAGLLGWLRFMPVGEAELTGWGSALVIIGLAAAFYGVLFGLLQRRAKVVLAYSSISQMGLLTAAVGLALAAPAQAPALLAAATLYALHHGLAKGGLFLAVDAHARRGASRWTFAVLTLLALALAGAPLTSGALAKAVYKASLPQEWAWLAGGLAISTLATTLLMARFLVLAWRQRSSAPPVRGEGKLAILLPVAGGFLLVPLVHGSAFPTASSAAYWPLALGVLLAAWLLWRPFSLLSGLPGSVPAGDLPALIGRRLRRIADVTRISPLAMPLVPSGSALFGRLDNLETRLRRWAVAGALWLMMMLVLALVLIPDPNS